MSKADEVHGPRGLYRGRSAGDTRGVVTRRRVNSIAIELTSHCNQRCSYCYNAWREDNGKGVGALPSEELLALVDRALTEVAFDEVTLTGGYFPARTLAHDLVTPLWTGADDRPYPSLRPAV